MQSKELSKEDEASMDVEFNLLQQRFNKIELVKAKEKKLYSQKQEKRQNMRRINVTNTMKLIKRFKAFLIRELVLIKHLRNPIQDYPI